MNTAAQSVVSAQQYNQAARMAILANGLDMLQQIYGQAISPTQNPTGVVNVQPQNIGLIKGFYIEVVGTLHNSGASTASLTGFGASNAISQVVYNDLQNNVRVNTTGWHLALLDAARQGFPYGAAISPGLPIGFGANYAVQSAPSTIAAAADGAFRFCWYLPLAYAADDFRGAVYAAVVQATQNLQITLNMAPGVAAGDAISAVYSGATTAVAWKAGTSITLNVYQSYIDQIPRDQNGVPILPIVDLSTIYEIKNTTVQGVVANADYGIPYANFRDFLSTFATYDQAGALSAGTDINYWAVQAANFTNFVKVSPFIQALRARATFMADPPAGTYYFDSRKKPINTNQYGNTQLVLNALTAAAQSTVLVGYEAFAYTQALVQAGSLPS